VSFDVRASEASVRKVIAEALGIVKDARRADAEAEKKAW
jgi:hypothetical protein